MSVRDSWTRINRHRFTNSVAMSQLSPAAVMVLDQLWCIAVDEGDAAWLDGVPVDVIVAADKVEAGVVLLELPRHPDVTLASVMDSLDEIEGLGLLERVATRGEVCFPKLAQYSARRWKERERLKTLNAARSRKRKDTRVATRDGASPRKQTRVNAQERRGEEKSSGGWPRQPKPPLLNAQPREESPDDPGAGPSQPLRAAGPATELEAVAKKTYDRTRWQECPECHLKPSNAAQIHDVEVLAWGDPCEAHGEHRALHGDQRCLSCDKRWIVTIPSCPDEETAP